MRAILFAMLVVLAGCSRLNNPEVTGDAGAMEAIQVAEGDWPWWRGPAGDNHAPDSGPPFDLKQPLWKTPIPGRGHSSPILWGERIFLTTALDDVEEQRLLCLDRQTGQVLWNTLVHQGGLPAIHGENTHASATPATDGERVYVAFLNHQGLQVSAVDFQGQIVWQTTAGEYASRWGYGSSPALYQSLVIVAGDNNSSGFIAALQRKSGALVWRKPRPSEDSYGTPVVGKVAGRDQLLLVGADTVAGHDPATGSLLWSCDGPAPTCANTVAWAGDLVFASGGYPRKQFLAVRATGQGQVVWSHGQAVAYVPSPVADHEHVYTVSNEGIAHCLDTLTGNVRGEERLGGTFRASPLLAGGKLYVPNLSGRLFVLEAGPRLQRLASADLGEACFASPVIAGGRLYQRGGQHLFCFGK